MFRLSVCGLAALASVQAGETVLHNFAYLPNGASPRTSVVRDSSGNLYGTTTSGGTSNAGVVYKVDTGGVETVLYTFTGGSDGGQPQAGVFRDAAGNIYGTTSSGGSAGQGVVFRLSASGKETVLYSFTGGADGGRPYAGVSLDAAGNIYGTTLAGGTAGLGVVYKVSPSGKETVLYSFTGFPADGAAPYGGVIRDSAGNFYGTTSSGGASNLGSVFKIDSTGHESLLYSFSSSGFRPLGGVVRDSAGNLYGTTSFGTGGPGSVFKLDPGGNETVLHSFTNGADGGQPAAGVVLDPVGNLYGTTSGGGSAGAGVVFKIDPMGNETVLCGFASPVDGGSPYAGVILDSAGNIYGTASTGGAANLGAVFELDPSGNETVLYNFQGGTDGYSPYAGLVRDSSGNFYGTTVTGGPTQAGIVFKLAPNGRETILYTFTGGADGKNPYAGVIRDSSGNLYGTTYSGGASNSGVVFKIDSSGHQTVLYSFANGIDGGFPEDGLIRDSAGNLYGTASTGGASGAGVVFKLDNTGHETVLYNFTGGTDGAHPYAGLVRDSAGNLYGTTPYGGNKGYGVVYKVTPAGSETVIYSFKGTADGANPQAGLLRDSAGNLYGTALHGGADSAGVVFKVTPGHTESVLYSFTGGADGSLPLAGLVRDAGGNFYGTTFYGGAAGAGVVYQLTPAGVETVLYSFSGGSDGAGPFAGVILDSSGDVFGTASSGGTKLGGVVFKVTP